MIADAYPLFQKSKNTFNVDHHISNGNYAKYNLVVDSAANCENVYNVITGLHIEIDKTIAERLLLGISTDTGNFMHSNVTSETLGVASELVACGGDLHKIA